MLSRRRRASRRRHRSETAGCRGDTVDPSIRPSRGSITLPAEVRHRHHLDQPGAQVQIVERKDGVIELHPLLPHRADQTWFWTKRWQTMEQEAEGDITAGRVETFDNADEFVADLEREAGDRGLA
ncbi:MAG: hypothetical protein ACRDKL_06835 [Solirubrobacteraceae bacterium]